MRFLDNADPGFSATARRLGITSAIVVLGLQIVYAITLAVGFLSLTSPEQPIGDPMFAILETLIILMMPAMVGLMVAVHAWAPAQKKTLSLTALAFMILVAGVTCSLHFLILTLGRQPSLVGMPELRSLLTFEWPSVAYALDILAWDVFFALSMFFAAPVFTGSKLELSIRALMVISGVLALAGLAGIVAGDMRLRNIGIVGYLGVFLFIAALLAKLFHRANPISDSTGDPNG